MYLLLLYLVTDPIGHSFNAYLAACDSPIAPLSRVISLHIENNIMLVRDRWGLNTLCTHIWQRIASFILITNFSRGQMQRQSLVCEILRGDGLILELADMVLYFFF